MDKIFINGQVLTMNPKAPFASAFATIGDRFCAVGPDAEVRKYACANTEIIDLDGKTVVPGFIETHNHLSWFSVFVLWADCGSQRNGTIEDVKSRIREKVEASGAGEWIRGHGYDDTMIADNRHLTRYDLDEVSPENPVMVMHTSGHLAYVNSKALELSGIGPETSQPDGGEIHKDENGVPTGLLKEMSAIMMVGSDFFAEQSDWQTKELLQAAIAHLHKAGVTSIHDGGVGSFQYLKAYSELEREGKLNLRVYATLLESLYQEILKIGLGTGFGSEHVKIGSVKLLQDGSIQARTAALQEPYHDNPDCKGDLIMAQEALDELVEKYHRAGNQIAIHGNGSAAIESIILAMERAQAVFPRQDHRHMIIHCQTASMDHIVRMKRLGIVPSYFVNHTYYWGDRHYSMFLGPERASRISPLASSLKEGLVFTLHSDLPVTPIDPLFSMYCAVNRITREGMVLGPEERIPPLEALKTYTTYAAYCSFEEDVKGSIETGKLADFVILSDNPLDVEHDKIKDIDVLSTVVGGEMVFEKASY
ncbi:MAG: amidohydrolase [Chloroflexi bacterium]|nr:amidohydrolase [Chloroflexota bacterium]